jgi:tetratricopeptide (TPR) repeat protein
VVGVATATLAAPGDGTRALPALEVVGSMQHVAAPVAAAPDSEAAEPAPVEAADAVEPDASEEPGEAAEVAEAALEPGELDEGEEEELDPEGVEPTGDRRLDVGRARANRLVNLGHRLRRGGRLGMAEASYLKALDAEPRYARAMAGLVRVHLKRRDGVEALRWARKLTGLQPRRANNQLLLGDAYALMDAHGAASKAWKTAARYGSRVARKRLANAR